MEGNQMKMREAVVALLDAMDSLGCDEETATLAAFVPGMEDSSAKCLAAFRKAKDALSAPPRQCDVGTPDEQDRRWSSNCGHGIPRCSECAVYAEAKKLGLVKHRYLMKSDCKFVWAQMPYAQEGAAK